MDRWLSSGIVKDEAWKFVDDENFIKVINLAAVGLTSYNAKLQVPSDIAVDQHYLPTSSLKTQDLLNRISD